MHPCSRVLNSSVRKFFSPLIPLDKVNFSYRSYINNVTLGLLLPIRSAEYLGRAWNSSLFESGGLGASLPVYSWALGALASCLLFSPCVFSILCTALMIRRVSSEHIRDGGTSLFGSKQNTYPPIGKAWKELCSGFNKIKQAHFGYNIVARAGKRVLSFLDQFSFCICLTQEFQTTRCWGSTDRFSDYNVVEIQRRRIWGILFLSLSLCELVSVLSRVHGIYRLIFKKKKHDFWGDGPSKKVGQASPRHASSLLR